MHRKVVTILFCDVVGSTTLGESVDPEALQGILAHYFERMKEIVERHGGTVEKFIGDAVMAVFGVPQVHEDDALRACRAAVEMRAAFAELGVEGRIGINTGEVVTGTEERLAAGDPVNVAARLQSAADPGEILVGAATLDLLGAAVEADAIEPLELKGKSEPVAASRLLAVGEVERSHDSRFVGRERELALMAEALESDKARLVTIVGDPGIGKSRLVAEALTGVDSRVIRARCLPYGEGITYWPVVEAIKQLDALPTDPVAASAIGSLLGETDAPARAEEIAWAFRKLLEEQAPLVVVFDDIQWGEDTFLDLLEGAALMIAGPVLLVCIARPELLARRAEWPVTLRLEPLPEASVDELLVELPAELHDRVARAAAGNPLFLTEMMAMADEDAEVDVPPTLRALLAARLDQLDERERRILERGAVEGEIFHRGAVQALAPEEQQVTPRLAALTRKELIRPDRAQLPGEDGFRFRHLLIRDAAYDALPKSTRAELHERFADWMEIHGGGLVELDEILGYHLEQAALYKAELGSPDAALADRAAARLIRAGRRANWRGDYRGRLIERALVLTRPQRLDVHLELETVNEELWPEEGAENAERVAQLAREAGDPAGEALSLTVAAFARTQTGGDSEELEYLARAALPLLEARQDHAGLSRVWHILGHGVANVAGRFADWAEAAEASLHHRRLAGLEYPVGQSGLLAALVHGPMPADEALDIFASILPANPDPFADLRRSELLAMLGRFDEAWAIARPAAERLSDIGSDEGLDALARLYVCTGDYERAVAYRGQYCQLLERQARWALLSTYAPGLGRFLCILGRYDEAEPLARQGRELGAADDLNTQMLWRQVQALVLARRGVHDQAEQLAHDAVAIAERMDGLDYQGDALCDLAEVLIAAGRTDEAVAAYEQALDRYGRKKNLAMIAQLRPKLEALRMHA